MTELRFDGRVAVITGAGRGIGRAHALLLAARGAAVTVVDLGAEADEVAAEITASQGRAIACRASVIDESDVRSVVDTTINEFGRLDIVINNAGIFDPAPFADLSIGQFRSMMDVHFYGTMLLTKAAWPHLVAAGCGRVLNTVSEGMLGIPQMTSYGAAKGAIFGFTRNVALDGREHGINVNAIAPQAGTRMVDDLGVRFNIPAEAVAQMKAGMPADLVAPVAAYLVHESCSLTAEVFCVGSGRVSRLAVVESAGYTDPALTPESVVVNLDTITDLAGATPRYFMGADV